MLFAMLEFRIDQIIGMHMSPTPWAQVADTLHAAGL